MIGVIKKGVCHWQARPEELTLEDFVAFYNAVGSVSPSPAVAESTVEELVQL